MDKVLFNFHDLILIITAFECLLFGLLVGITSAKNLKTLFFVSFLICYALITLHELVFWGERFRLWMLEISPNLFFIAGNAYFIEGALLYLFVKSLLIENFSVNPSYEESLDINDFNISFTKGLTLEDGASTLTDFTASQISKALVHSETGAEEIIWLVCGGGRKNKYLMKSIIRQSAEYLKIKGLKKIVLHTSEKYGIDGDYVESQAFGYLAIRSFLKLPISFPNTTGCKETISGGVLAKNF